MVESKVHSQAIFHNRSLTLRSSSSTNIKVVLHVWLENWCSSTGHGIAKHTKDITSYRTAVAAAR